VFEGRELVIATHNAGKAREIADLLRPVPALERFYTASDLGLDEPEETGVTFQENAELKARAAATATGKPSLADDSGLSVYALGGEPGIYSARWAQREDGTRDFDYAMEVVRGALGDSQDRRAAFICVLALAWPDGYVQSFEGRVEGELAFPARGEKGFGYDPIFIPAGYTMTFAEMEPAEKHAISHRADAFAQFMAYFAEFEAK